MNLILDIDIIIFQTIHRFHRHLTGHKLSNNTQFKFLAAPVQT